MQPELINAYKIDIQQGNVLTQEMVAQLKPGQTREQVRYILGTPLLADIFHQQRWDYVYSYRNGRTGRSRTRQFSVFFDKDNRLEKATGDVEVADLDELAAPNASTRLVDFGTLPADGSPMPATRGAGILPGPDEFGRILIMNKTRVGIVGAGGRMGRMLLEVALKDDGIVLGGAFDVPGSPAIGQTVEQLTGLASEIRVTDDLAAGLAGIDCLIDFTRPQGTLGHLELCRKAGVAMVIGTTGFEAEGKDRIAEAARDIPVVFAPNMAVGVNLVFKLLDTAARILNQGYDIEIVEAHHRMKVDAPSGTALRMGEVVASALGRDLKECAVYGREGVTGERDPFDHRLRHGARRRCGRRSHGDVLRDRRAGRNHPQGGQSHALRAGQHARGAFSCRSPERPVRHAGRARLALNSMMPAGGRGLLPRRGARP